MEQPVPYRRPIKGGPPDLLVTDPFFHERPIPRSLVWRYRLRGRYWGVFMDWLVDHGQAD